LLRAAAIGRNHAFSSVFNQFAGNLPGHSKPASNLLGAELMGDVVKCSREAVPATYPA